MKLRAWQSECIAQALTQFMGEQSHFLCLATPGAGKTTMASLLAKRLVSDCLIDLVICFAPSVIVVDDFRAELEIHIGERMDGLIGSRGSAMTYQAMLNLPENFWSIFSHHRVLVIFDEIHHCAGLTRNSANAWGERIICEIQGRSTYTLALTGTPWRTDSIPIVLSRYSADTGRIHCDYQYGLYQAINDRVCRIPHLTAIDNDNIVLAYGEDSLPFSSFKALLEESPCTYQQLIEQETLIEYILTQADRKLSEIRKVTPNAGGLIVAASVGHANLIARLLKKSLNEDAFVVTHYEADAGDSIRAFKYGSTKWIISVGMISEGTNIPRLQVCCYLTRVKTELYFRQVLGRILRSSGSQRESAHLYMPAEPTLLQYAQRIAEDIPQFDIVKTELMRTPNGSNNSSQSRHESLGALKTFSIGLEETELRPLATDVPSSQNRHSLSQGYDTAIGLFGRFRQELLSIGNSKVIR